MSSTSYCHHSSLGSLKPTVCPKNRLRLGHANSYPLSYFKLSKGFKLMLTRLSSWSMKSRLFNNQPITSINLQNWLSRFVRSATNVKDSFILIISHFNKQIDIIYEIKKRNGIMGLFFFGIEGHFWFTESGNWIRTNWSEDFVVK